MSTKKSNYEMMILPCGFMTEKSEVAVLAGGCFWCTEAVFQEVEGVLRVDPGYSGGHAENPSYEDVCSGRTGHAEAVRITYDPSVISFREILEVFFSMHDPTSLNRQGNDVGTQYRSAIFYMNEGQRKTAEEAIAELEKNGEYRNDIVTAIDEFRNFYPAEDYHRNYFRNNSEAAYCRLVISPKMKKFRKKHAPLLKRF